MHGHEPLIRPVASHTAMAMCRCFMAAIKTMQIPELELTGQVDFSSGRVAAPRARSKVTIRHKPPQRSETLRPCRMAAWLSARPTEPHALPRPASLWSMTMS